MLSCPFFVLPSSPQLVTCNMCGCGKYMDAVFTVLAAAWWLAAGFILAAQVGSSAAACWLIKRRGQAERHQCYRALAVCADCAASLDVSVCVCCVPHASCAGAYCSRHAVSCCAVQAKSANEASPTIPGQEWRTAIVLLSWITSGLFGLLFLVHLGRIGVSCCRKRRRGHSSEQDLEKAGLAAGRPPSAAVELGKEVANRCVCVCLSRLGAGGFNTCRQGNSQGSMVLPAPRPRVLGDRLGCGMWRSGIRQTRRFCGRAGPASHAAMQAAVCTCAHAACADHRCCCAPAAASCPHTQALHEQGPVWQRQGQAGPGPSAAISRQHLPAGAKHLMSAH